MRIAVVGRKGLGGVQMRGVDVANVNGWEFFDIDRLPAGQRFDVLLVVKYFYGHGTALRKMCDRLVWDPLDCWMSDTPNANPEDFFSSKLKQLRFDDLLGTSPSCAETMAGYVPECHVHMLPHHADPRIDSSWHDPDGPIVYAGGRQYIEKHLGAIERACRHLGRKFVGNFGRRPVDSLRGAALHLHPRFPPQDTVLNRLCKPQIKMANAAAAGCPTLYTSHPCATSLNAGGAQIDHLENWERLISRALKSAPPEKQPTLTEHAAELVNLLAGAGVLT